MGIEDNELAVRTEPQRLEHVGAGRRQVTDMPDAGEPAAMAAAGEQCDQIDGLGDESARHCHDGFLENEFDVRLVAAINDMLLDMLAAISQRNYEQRRGLQAQGIAEARAAGKYRGRQADQARYEAINRMLASGNSWSVVERTIGCSRSTISKALKHVASSGCVSTTRAAPKPKP